MQKAIAVFLVYFLGLVQGIAFTTIPAAANFLTAGDGFHFTDADYGSIFLPMIFGAIFASFSGGALAKSYSAKNVLLTGIALSSLAMLSFASAAIFTEERYLIMLLTMLLLGTGFGANITSLNPFAIHFFPNRGSSAVTALHSCLGIGTAIGPLLWVYFSGSGLWWADPTLLCVVFAALFILGLIFLPRSAELEGAAGAPPVSHNRLLWTFAFIAFLYGIVETTYGNWTTIYFHQEKGMTTAGANTLLSLFWLSVTGGRVIATFLSLALAPKWIYRALPLLVLAGAIAIVAVSTFGASAAVMVIAGLGCSAFLPLSVSFGVQNFKADPTYASGLVIGTYMIGYGVAAEGIGFLHKAEGVSFQALFLIVAAIAILLLGLNFASTRLMRQGR
jgi:MFS transporter, FHS family, glucose/mannose:H+ symporter